MPWGPFTLGDDDEDITVRAPSHLTMATNWILADVIMNRCCTYLTDDIVNSNLSSSSSVSGPLLTHWPGFVSTNVEKTVCNIM